jgi:hypothetical protein
VHAGIALKEIDMLEHSRVAATACVAAALVGACAQPESAPQGDVYNSPVNRVGSHIPVGREHAAPPDVREADRRILEDEINRQRGYKPPRGG